jgi:tRNA-uridine 2-sulfurtransferase
MNALNPAFKRHFEEPRNAGIPDLYNCIGRDSSLRSDATVIYYGLIEDRKIKDIGFRTFGCSYSIAASSCTTVLVKGKSIADASRIWEEDIEGELGIFPENRKDSLNVALGAFHAMLSSYIDNISYGAILPGGSTAAAMSGGLDSSMAASLLVHKGLPVTGITMKVLPDDELPLEKRITSWMSMDIYSARRVCRALGIPHFTVDLSREFEKKIIGPFCAEYLKGRTPNPCVECNRSIKFGTLLDACRKLGAGTMATGHYCRVEKPCESSSFMVRKGRDRSKEQSYVFWRLSQSQLSRISTPLGELTKEEVRNMSSDFLPFLENRDESQDICFIAGDRYHGFLQKRIKETGRGRILDTHGREIGEHRGFPYYTIGQRKGLGISHPRPLYVIKIIPEENIIVAGEKEELLRDRAALTDVNFIAGSPPADEFRALVKIRYNSPEEESVIKAGPQNTAKVFFKKKVSSVTPGQSAVFYDGDILLGGGIIDS